MIPKGLPQTHKKRPKSHQNRTRRSRGILLDVQGLILEVKTLIFGPPETHFLYFFEKEVVRCTQVVRCTRVVRFSFINNVRMSCQKPARNQTHQLPPANAKNQQGAAVSAQPTTIKSHKSIILIK